MPDTTTAAWAYQMLGSETIWTTAAQVHTALRAREIAHAVVGDVAVCLHGYRRTTTDVDLLIRPADQPPVREALTAAGLAWQPHARQFVSSTGVSVQFLLSGDRPGAGQEVRFPDPADPQCVTSIEGLPVVTLAELIQSKLASGLGSVRCLHRDLADVVELIATHQLDGSFARHLHKSLRK